MASILSYFRRHHELPQPQPSTGQDTPNAVQAESAPATALPESGQRHPPASHLRKALAGLLPNLEHRPAPPSPQPPRWFGPIDLSQVRFPANVAVPRIEDVTTWITQLQHSSGVVKKRHSVGAGLYFHKPSSPRYQFAKHQMNAHERTQLTAILRHLMEQHGLDSHARNEITDLYLSLQHARLRTHTPQQRAALRRAHGNEGLLAVAGLLPGPATMMVPLLMLDRSLATHRDYYRSPGRPEYGAAVADMGELLGSPNVAEEIKLKIAGEILDRYIRSEKLFSTEHADSILLALNMGVVPEDLRQWLGRPQGMTSRILRDPSTDAQKRRLIEWALDPNNYSGEKSARLDLTLERLYKTINELFQDEGRAPLTPPVDLAAWNKKRNAFHFDRLLKRAEEDAAAVPSRKAAVYHNVAAILDAITADPSFAEQVFHDSVGGTQHCMHNALEYISELAVRSRNRTLVRQIESGAMGIEQFREASLSALRLETLQQYIARVIVPDAIRESSAVRRTFEPEISQMVKSSLKDLLNLPQSVNHSDAFYPGKEKNHKRYVKDARSYVTEFAGDRDNQRKFFLTDPLWREGVIALARRQGNKHDIDTLERYTSRLSDYTWDEEKLMDEAGKPIQDRDLERAVRACAGLNQLYRPRTGQKILNADGREKDKYKTEIAAFQDLYDRIEVMEKQFRIAIQDIGKQFASHVTDSILSDDAILPADGNFAPHFKLPETWEVEMGRLATMSRAAELVELSDVFQKKEKDIKKLNQEVEHFVKSGTFNGVAGATQPLDEEQRAALVKAMREFYGAAPHVLRRFDLHAYLGMNLSDDQPLPDELVQLRTKIIELQQAENALSLNYSTLRNADTLVLEEAAAIQEDGLNALLKNLDDPAVSQDFSPLNREQVHSLRKEMEQFYANPDNWNERFAIGQHIARVLETGSGDAQQPPPGPSKRESKSRTTHAAAEPKRKGDIPVSVLALRDMIWAAAQARHVYAMTAQRLKDVKAPAFFMTEPQWTGYIAQPSEPQATGFSRSLSSSDIAFDPRAIRAVQVLDENLPSEPLEPVRAEEAEELRTSALNRKAFGADFDVDTNAPTQEYVDAMTVNARHARITLGRVGLETGVASGAGSNCLIHSILDGMGITGEDNLNMANGLRQDLITRLGARGEPLGLFEYLNTFGSHPATLVDLINERFPGADVGLRIYTPLPGGGLFFSNPESEGGTTNQARRNTIAVMWVGNHYEPIKMKNPEASHSL